MTATIENSHTVLVTDAGRGSAVAFIRSLGRKGYRVIAADCSPYSAGFFSRHAAGKLVYPSPEAAPEAYVGAMLDAVRRESVDLVIPVTDPAIIPLSREREQFAPHCQLALPEPNALGATRDKLQTFRLAEGLGVPIPKMHLVWTAEEAIEAARDLGWPVVVKPRMSRRFADGAIESLEVSYANNVSQLSANLQACEEHLPVLLQQFVEGVGVGVELLMHRGRALAAFQHRRVREMPVSGGPSSLRVSAPLDAALYNYSVRLLQAIDWTGLAMVEFKLGPDGPKLMEINGRVWGSMPLAVHSGVDFPLQLAELYLDVASAELRRPQARYRVGVKARNLELELKWILAVLAGRRRYFFLKTPARAKAAGALLQLLDPRCRFDVFSWKDPLPALAAASKVGGLLYSRLRAQRSLTSTKGSKEVCLPSH